MIAGITNSINYQEQTYSQHSYKKLLLLLIIKTNMMTLLQKINIC